MLIGWCDPLGLVPAKRTPSAQVDLRRGLLVTVVLGLLAAFLFGVGSISEVRGEWWWWTFLPFAVFDVLGLYLLVGADLWAFLDRDASALKSTRGVPGLFVVLGLLVGLLSAYVANHQII